MLRQKGYEELCPTYTLEKKWSDRWKRVEEPLFPGYVFVRTPGSRIGGLLCSTPGVMRILSFGGRPSVLPDVEVDAIRCLSTKGKALPAPAFHQGEAVRVCDGPFAGITGVVEQIRGKKCFVFRVRMIAQSIYVEVEGCSLERLDPMTAVEANA